MSGRVCTARGVRVGPRDLRGAAAACDARRHTLTATPRGVARSEAAAVGWRRRASSHGMTVGRGGRGRSCLRATGENGGAPVEEGCETEEHKAADSSNVEVEDVSKDVPSEQPGVEMWAAEAQEEINFFLDIRTDRQLAAIYSELLRGKIPLHALITTEMKLSAYLALLVALSRSRHWTAGQALHEHMLDIATGPSAPTEFYLHLAEQRLDDNQLLPALEVFKWCEATLRPPSSQLFELFARVAGRCSDVQKATAEYQAVADWMRKSDAGRAMWHVYMGLNGNGLLPDNYRRINGVISIEQQKTWGELQQDRRYENMGKGRRRRGGSSSKPFDDNIPGL